jgi:hypothetical protein
MIELVVLVFISLRILYVPKIFPVLLTLLANKVMGGGDFSQRPKEDRDSPDIGS